MKRWSAARLLVTVGICLAACIVAAALCMMVGSTGIYWPPHAERSYRLEPVMVSALVGAALAMAGVAYQAVLRNPLADPYLLGVSSGASLAAYLWRLPLLASLLGAVGLGGSSIGQWSQPVFAFAGALVAIVLVLGLAGLRGRLEPVTLLLVGVIVNAVNGSIFLLINAKYRDLPGTGGPISFLVGGIQPAEPRQLLAALTLIFAGWLLLMYLGGQLNVAGLGEGEAQSLGVRIHRLRWITLVSASLVTAAAVSISGPIGFVGLVCPHVARLIVGPDQRRLLPVATATGAILLMIADAVSRFLANDRYLGTQLQVGILTGLLGGPFFLWLLWKSRQTL